MKTLSNLVIGCLFVTIVIPLGCHKDNKNGCAYSACDGRRKTVMTLADEKGTMAYIYSLERWAVNITRPGYDSMLTGIICTGIRDSLRSEGKEVTVSGALKESCGYPKPVLGGQYIFYFHPISFI